eukprot:4261807-Prymnesium_polylepis.1
MPIESQPYEATPPAICHQPYATNHMPPAICHQPNATSHMPPAKCHQPNATSHMPPAICGETTPEAQAGRQRAAPNAARGRLS